MIESVPAIYEKGTLRLLSPLGLPDHTEVQVYVQVPSSNSIEHRQQVRAALHAAGLSLPVPDAPSAHVPLSEERRDELARLFATGQPLSEVIIEERSGR